MNVLCVLLMSRFYSFISLWIKYLLKCLTTLICVVVFCYVDGDILCKLCQNIFSPTLQSYFDWKLWWGKFPQWCNEETRRCALHNNNLYFFLLVYVRVESEDEAGSEVVRQKCWGMNTEYPNCHTGHGSTPFYNLETFLMQLCHCHIHHSACNDALWEIQDIFQQILSFLATFLCLILWTLVKFQY